ncbi:S41 family peptidase [Bernardetia sp. MNP-M8]|uniref:S41 family peptidase n=1 Tax=Bernardetia sp. MNP-M8 TaxID=3127470 RepID=UPI0030CFC81C
MNTLTKSSKWILAAFALLLTFPVLAQTDTQNTQTTTDNENPLWMRYSAISPNGQNIAFCYKGDIYKVDANGGRASLLTLHEAYDVNPVWSPDGKMMAFASDRFGNKDIFLMSADGGEPKRLTIHSSDDTPVAFSPDGKFVYFNAYRMPTKSDVAFPFGGFEQLYKVAIDGKTRPEMVINEVTQKGNLNAAGNKLVYEDRKGYENEWRKHHVSSVARDIWVYDMATKKHTQLTRNLEEDRNPVWVGDDVYFLSEKGGVDNDKVSMNIFKMSAANPSVQTKVTNLENHPVRFLSSSNDKTLCFGYNGEIYTMKDGSEPKKIAIQIAQDNRYNAIEYKNLKGGITDMAVSSTGKEIAFIVRGEVFVTAVENGYTKQITNTAEQERNVDFSPDGKSLIYSAERNGSWNVYQAKLGREEEKYFYASTVLNETQLTNNKNESFQPLFSPDGKEVAYIEDRKALKVINLASKEVRTVTDKLSYSYADGDQYYAWSPDSKWFLITYEPNKAWIPQVGLIAATGKEAIKNLTQSGYNDAAPRFAMNGKAFYWLSDKEGLRSHGSWGSEYDAYIQFFEEDEWKKFTMSKEEYTLWEELNGKDKDKKDEDKKEDDKDEKDKKDEKVEPLTFDWAGFEDRKERLTSHASQMSDAALSPKGDKLYYLTSFEKGADLWVEDLREKETKLVLKLGVRGGSLTMDKEGKNLFLLANGSIQKIDLATNTPKPVSIDAKMQLNAAAEREYMFEHMWRQVREKFYVTDIHGVDWDFYKKEYARFLPHINNNYDFAEMGSELLGELNASHTGTRYRHSDPNGDMTAVLGAFYDDSYKGNGLKIAEVLNKSPLQKANKDIAAGDIIQKIDGVEITPTMNYHSLLNRKADERTLLTILDAKTNATKEVIVLPIQTWEERQLLYERWVNTRREETEKISDGKVGYVHVRGMNSDSFRELFSEALGRHGNKKALIVDTRFNGGGWLHDDLATFLSGKQYFEIVPRGEKIGTEPMYKWNKPSTVLMNEGNYSDANIFPYVYQHLQIGKLIGMPVAGTGTAVWWERLIDPTIVFGIPQVGIIRTDGKYMENTELIPDIEIKNNPTPQSEGKDEQLEGAVKEMLEVTK